MNNTDFETFKLQAVEKLTVRYDKYITKLKKMLNKAHKLERYLQKDYRGYVAIECGDICQNLSPLQVTQFIIRDIQALIPLIERERNKAQRDIMETEDHNDLELVKVWAGNQLAAYGRNIRNLKKSLQAFKDGYGTGVEAYILYRRAWKERYIN
jgi:hypothetical protein